MQLVYDTTTGQIVERVTHGEYPNSLLPDRPSLEKGFIYLVCDDESEQAEKIRKAHDYTVTYDSNHQVTGVTVTQTEEEYLMSGLLERPQPSTNEERLAELELALADLVGGA